MFVSFTKIICAQNGWTALTIACKEGHDEIVQILVQAGADLNFQANVIIHAILSHQDLFIMPLIVSLRMEKLFCG